MIILVGGEKGGTGKTSLSQNLAACLQLRTQSRVALVDCDPQRCTSQWEQARQQLSLPKIDCVQLYGNIGNDLASLQRSYGIVIVDCGSSDQRALRSSFMVADYALLPLRPKLGDLRTLSQLNELIYTCKLVNRKLKHAIVLTQCPVATPLQARLADAIQVCRDNGVKLLSAATHELDIYDDCQASGYSVGELEPHGHAAQEIEAIAEELLLELELLPEMEQVS